MFQGMAEMKKKFEDKRSRDRQEIEDWMYGRTGGLVMGGIVVAIVVWGAISVFI